MTQDVLRRPSGAPRPIPPVTALRPAAGPAAVPPPNLPAVQPPTRTPTPADDPDATQVIGRHRADGTREPKGAPPRRWIGRVAAAAVALIRRRPAEDDE